MNRIVFMAFLMAPAIRVEAQIRLDDQQALAVGRKIWINEAGGKVELLTHWNIGEDFASLGIGHFIWYSKNRRGPFTESFPGLLKAIESTRRRLPRWLRGSPPCPWSQRDEFYAQFNSPKMNELRALLADTVDLQARYAANRLEAALPKILEASPPERRKNLTTRFTNVASVPNGVYALMDYVNFKGEGVNPSERYKNQGWGLLQVLDNMEQANPGQPSVEAFAKAADQVLSRRVDNSPPERNEVRWLPVWRKRVATYLEP